MEHIFSMVQHIAMRLWSMRREFAKYFVIGVTSFLLDLGSLYVFKERLHFKPYTAVIINQLFIVNFVFFMNKYWSFQAAGVTHKQLFKFIGLSTFNYLFSITWMWFFTEYYKINFVHAEYSYLFVRTANVILAVTWNFFLYKYWVYRTPAETNKVSDTSINM